jgi:hypothetical protein
MMRAQRRLTRQPNKRKALLLHDLIDQYARQKDAYLVELVKIKNWRIWQSSKNAKRDFARLFSHHTLPVHIEDQCMFDAVTTLKSWVESAKARDHWKALVFKHTPVKEEQQTYFQTLKKYAALAKVLSGETYDPWLFHMLRNSLLQAPRVQQRRSAMLDDTNYRVFFDKEHQ